MDAIERAIRNAFEKGDPEDRAFRERVYRSAYAAMQKSIEANPNIDADGAAKRRDLFKRRVVEIEQEFVPAVETGADNAPAPVDAPDVTMADFGGYAPEPGLGDIRPGDRGAAEAVSFPADAPLVAERRATPGRQSDIPVGGERRGRKPPRRRRPYALAFIIVTLLAALGIGAWWAASLFFVPDGSVRNPPAQLESEDFEPESQAPAPASGMPSAEVERAWINVFEPSDPTRAQAPAGTSAEVRERDGQAMLRIASTSEGAAVAFDIGEGTLQRLAGRRAVFSIDVSGEESGETQISVECDFGTLRDCGRRRYIIGQERGEYLFELDLPQGTAGASGTISINPDITNAGRPLDIYRIRVAPAS